MNGMKSMRVAVELLIERLNQLVFVKVTNLVTRDENVFSFESKSGMTVWDSDPWFGEEREKFSAGEWEKAEKSYLYYFGFARNQNREFFFQKKNYDVHRLSDPPFVNLSNQSITPPSVGAMIAGYPTETSKGWALNDWFNVSHFELLVVNAVIGKGVLIPRNIAEMTSDKDINVRDLGEWARLVVLQDIGHYLNLRKMPDAKVQDIDWTVHRHTHVYRPELWQKYVEECQVQRIFSETVPVPAPKQIHDRLGVGCADPVGLVTPFANLTVGGVSN